MQQPQPEVDRRNRKSDGVERKRGHHDLGDHPNDQGNDNIFFKFIFKRKCNTFNFEKLLLILANGGSTEEECPTTDTEIKSLNTASHIWASGTLL